MLSGATTVGQVFDVVRGPSGLVNFGSAVNQWPQHLLREQEGRGRSILCGRSRRLSIIQPQNHMKVLHIRVNSIREFAM